MAEGGEIQVLVEAAGAEQAQEEISGVEDSVEEAGEGMEDTGEQMEGMTREMKGMGMALAASLAAASAGLLSQVPVLGEALGGIKAIAQAVAFQMDQLLRALGAGGLTTAMYDLSAAIFELEGPAGQFVGILGTMAAYAGLLAAAFSAPVAIAGALSAGVYLLAARLGRLKELVTLVLGVFAPLVAIGIVLDEVLRRLTGTGLIEHLQDLIDWLGGATDAFDAVVNGAQDLVDMATANVSGAFDWITGVFDDPLGTVRDIHDELLSIAGETFDTVVDVAMEISTPVTGGDGDGVFGTGVGPDIDVPSLQSGGFIESGGLVNVHAGERVVPADVQRGGDQGFSADRGDAPPVVRMDGRRLTQQDSRYRRNGTASRGRNG